MVERVLFKKEIKSRNTREYSEGIRADCARIECCFLQWRNKERGLSCRERDDKRRSRHFVNGTANTGREGFDDYCWSNNGGRNEVSGMETLSTDSVPLC